MTRDNRIRTKFNVQYFAIGCDRCHDIIGFNGKEKLGGKKQNKQALKEDTDCLWFGLIHVSIKKHD